MFIYPTELNYLKYKVKYLMNTFKVRPEREGDFELASKIVIDFSHHAFKASFITISLRVFSTQQQSTIKLKSNYFVQLCMTNNIS